MMIETIVEIVGIVVTMISIIVTLISIRQSRGKQTHQKKQPHPTEVIWLLFGI